MIVIMILYQSGFILKKINVKNGKHVEDIEEKF